jgi:hypothetical protein
VTTASTLCSVLERCIYILYVHVPTCTYVHIEVHVSSVSNSVPGGGYPSS